MKRPNLTTVGYAYSMADAAMASALLECSGILVTKHPWHTVCNSWDNTHAFGGIEIQVPASQAEDAAAVLADVHPISRLRKRLIALLFCITAFLIAWIPPPASGFFAVAIRPSAARDEDPAL